MSLQDCPLQYSRFDDEDLKFESVQHQHVVYSNDPEKNSDLMSVGVFACNMCSFVSKYKCSLQQHVKTHTDQRPYACPLCSYRGTHKHHLDNHLKTHTGVKPFACHLCEFTTAWKSCLKNHVLSKHNTQSS